MFNWSKYPLVRFLTAFIIGILLAFYGFIPNIPTIPALAIVVFIAILCLTLLKRFMLKYNILNIVILIIITFTGIVRTQYHITSQLPPTTIFEEYHHCKFIVNEVPIEKQKSIKLNGKIVAIKDNNNWKSTNYNSIIYIEKDKNSQLISYGDELYLFTKLQNIESSKNPKAFDYKDYLKIKNTHIQSYIPHWAWTLYRHNQGNFIMKHAISWRNTFLNIFSKADLDIKEFGIIASILLGSDDKLDPELAQSYAAAGASHILCVSGMHVGIIFMIINFLLAFMDFNRKSKIIKTFVLLIVIWGYACITGLSPSVMRAATMFTFMAIGGVLGRKTNTYNNLFVSMLFLLIFNPLLILEIGFQFSYLAVFGIVWLQPNLAGIYNCRTKIGNYIWGIITVSLAAQLATAPLATFYFHQFPNYFLLTNIIVISLAPIVVCSGILVLIFSFYNPIFQFLSWILIKIIQCMNFCIVGIEHLPFSTTNGIAFSALQTLLIYAFILTFASIFIYKRKKFIFLSLGITLCFLALEIKKQFDVLNLNQIVFYSTNSTPIIDYFYGKNVHCFTWDSLNNKDIHFNCDNYRIFNRYQSIQNFTNENYFTIGNKTILFLHQNPIVGKTNINANYLILSNNNYYNIEKLKEKIHFDTLLLDGTFSYKNRQRIIKQCDTLSINCFNLKENALIVNLK